jgi:hypothetical protein
MSAPCRAHHKKKAVSRRPDCCCCKKQCLVTYWDIPNAGQPMTLTLVIVNATFAAA